MLKHLFTTVFLLCSFLAHGQLTLHGKVTDSKAQPLSGATISIGELKKFGVTDEDGNFEIDKVTEGTYTLEVRFLGFKTLLISVLVPLKETLVIQLEEDVIITDQVIVEATRVLENSPTSFTTLNKGALQKQNFGQDLPLTLNWTPSLITTSDAGAGLGYTGLRIRGSDATRINVTINGIPVNDSESQGVFWVNTPDLASSTQSVQVQRGVGTSTNGAGAFGASVNLQTNTRNDKAYADVINSVGSFNTMRNTVMFGTGLIANQFAFDARVSKISSDGYIDRATSDLKSYYLSGGYYGKKTMLKAIIFGGKEITYQSWYGVPESRLKNDESAMLETAISEGWNEEQTANLLASGRTFNSYLYKNQVDDYAQDHYQLHVSHRLSEALTANMALHYTYGRGFYEEYRYDDDFTNYGLSALTVGDSLISSSDIIRRRWLDNHFYGTTYSLHYDTGKINSVLGGAWNTYDGDHFGEIAWAQVSNFPKDYRYYSNNGKKRDFNLYWKNSYQLSNHVNAFIDLQYRTISYVASGKENKQFDFNINKSFGFFNPKFGITFNANSQQQLYVSYGVANREPVRDDFVDAPIGIYPKHETLQNVEAGWRLRRQRLNFSVNYYLMSYKNQLVPTGKVNDVGALIRTNVSESYRTGIEVESALRISSTILWNANFTISRNKIKKFDEIMYDYGVNFDEYNEVQRTYSNTNLPFSPDFVAGSIFTYTLLKRVDIGLLSKYVGRQYLDNTSNSDRIITAYFVNDLRLSYSMKPNRLREISFSILANNIFNQQYSSNGYTYGYFGGGTEYRQNFYYPQAGRNYMLMVALKF